MSHKRLSFHQVWEYIRDYRFKSIWLRYFILLSVCIVLPMSVVEIWFSCQQKEQIHQEIIKRNEASLENGYTNIYSIIKSAKNVSFSLSINEDIRYAALQPVTTLDGLNKRESIADMLAVTCNSNSYIDSIYVYFEMSNLVITNRGSMDANSFADREALEEYQSEMPRRIIMFPRIKTGSYPYLLTILYPITDHFQNTIGMTVVNLDVEKLGDYIGSGRYRFIEYTPRMFIFDINRNMLVYSDEYRYLQEPDELYALLGLESASNTFSGIYSIFGSKYVVSAVQSEDDGLRYYYVSSIQEFENLTNRTDTRLLQGTVMTILLCVILGFLLSLWVYRPIQQTLKLLSEVSMLAGRDVQEHGDEVAAIRQSILIAKEENDALNLQMKERMLRLHTAQISALQAQINPHFLFNTLEAIANGAALLLGEENKVTDMICTLGKLMRISLTNTNYIVPLSEELEHIALYMKLFDFRFRDRIILHTNIPSVMLDEKIAKLTLQPLIENSLQHGLKKYRSGGEIWLWGERQGTDNLLYVEDNGTGISEDKREQLNTLLRQEAMQMFPGQDEHIGLSNVNWRLKLIFGESYGLRIEKSPHGGCRVVVHFGSI